MLQLHCSGFQRGIGFQGSRLKYPGLQGSRTKLFGLQGSRFHCDQIFWAPVIEITVAPGSTAKIAGLQGPPLWDPDCYQGWVIVSVVYSVVLSSGIKAVVEDLIRASTLTCASSC